MAKAAPIKNATANKHIAIQANGGRHASSGRFACLTKLKKFPTMKDRRWTQRLNGEEHGTVSPAKALLRRCCGFSDRGHLWRWLTRLSLLDDPQVAQDANAVDDPDTMRNVT